MGGKLFQKKPRMFFRMLRGVIVYNYWRRIFFLSLIIV